MAATETMDDQRNNFKVKMNRPGPEEESLTRMKLECITEKGGFGAEDKIKIYSKSRSGRKVKMERGREKGHD